jgi:lipopolysaccharide transport system permease protein
MENRGGLKSLRYRVDLIQHLVGREFTLRYKRSALGIFWSLLTPLAQLFVLVFLFGRVLPLSIEAYPAFVFCALLPWIWFSSCLSVAGGLFIHNRDLARRPNFEPSTLIVVNLLANLIHYVIFLPILLVFLAWYGRPLTTALFSLPVLLLVQGFLILGLGLVIATLNAFYHDVEFLVGVALMLLFYLTPVFYRIETLGDQFRIFYMVNPMAVLIQGYRGIFFYGTAPEWGPLALAAVISIVLFGLGYFVYKHQLSNVIDAL